MAITPQPGYKVDPNNPNGVIPIGSDVSNIQPAPLPTSKFGSSTMPIVNRNVTTATTAGTSSLPAGTNIDTTGMTGAQTAGVTAGQTPTTPTPTTPVAPTIQNLTSTSKLTSDQLNSLGIKDTTGWTANSDGTFTPPATGTQLQTLKTQNLIDTLITPQLTGVSGINPVANSDGSITITTAGGGNVNIPSSLITNADGTPNPDAQKNISEFVNQTKTAEQTVTATKSSADSQMAQLNAQKATQQAQLDKAKQTALANAKAAMAAANPYGVPSSDEAAYTNAVEQQFALQQSSLDNAYQAASAQIEQNTTSATSKAYSDLNTAVQGIMDNAQQASTQEKTFAFNQQQKSMTDFQNLATKFDTSNLPSGTNLNTLTIGANGTTGVASVDAIIAAGVKGGLTPEQALGLIQGQTLAQTKADSASWLANLKNFSLPDMSKMDLATAQADPMIGSLIKQGATVFGSNEAAYEAIKSSYAQQKQALDLQKEQAQAQLALVNAQLAPLKFEETQARGTVNIIQKTVNSLTKTNTPIGQLNSTIKWFNDAQSSLDEMASGNAQAGIGVMDSVIKVFNGGMAIRGQQADMISESSSVAEKAAAIGKKFGIDISLDKNNSPIISYAVAQRLVASARASMKSNVDLVKPTIDSLNQQVSDAQNRFPSQAANMDTALAPLQPISDFIDSMNSDSGTSVSAEVQALRDKYKY